MPVLMGLVLEKEDPAEREAGGSAPPLVSSAFTNPLHGARDPALDQL